MLSFNNDLEFFNWLMSAEFRENQYSEQELLYMLKRFREEYRKVEGKKKSLENDVYNNVKRYENLEIDLQKLKNDLHITMCKNQVFVDRFKNGLSLWERLTGRVKY